jgi:hypothetical protein
MMLGQIAGAVRRAFTYHVIVFFRPASNDVVARNPNSASARDTSSDRRGWLFGLLVSHFDATAKPGHLAIFSARSPRSIVSAPIMRFSM